MLSLFEQVADLLSQPYGSMVYHLLVSFILISVLYPALGFSLSNQTTKSKRIFLGLGLLIGSRLLLFIASTLSTQDPTTFSSALPVLDRVVIALNLAIIVWLWVFEEPNRSGDFGTIILCLLITFGGIASIIFWNAEEGVNTFGGSFLAFGWDLFSALLLVAGQRLLMKKESQERNIALTMIVVIFLGECSQMILEMTTQYTNSDYPTIVRLAFMAAFPLMLGLTTRFREPISEAPVVVPVPLPPVEPVEPVEVQEDIVDTPKTLKKEPDVVPALMPKGIELKLFQTTMALASVDTPSEICRLITLYISHALVSDLCLLLSPPDENLQVHLICGYDLITEESIDSLTFSQGLITGYANVVENGSPLQIPASSSQHLIPFADLLHLDELGEMLIYPVTDANNKTLASIVLISPYSKYVWSGDDQSYLRDSNSIIASALEKVFYGQQEMEQVAQITNKLEMTQAEAESLRNELAAIKTQDTQQSKVIEDMEQLKKTYEITKETVDELRLENQALKQNLEQVIKENQALIDTPSEDVEKFQEELAQALGRASRLQTELNSANQIISKFEEKLMSGEALTSEQAEIIASIAQELRQPMSSITGYTDLLISESVGILGELQRKFLDRVRASIDRMNQLISDLIQITTLESGNLAISPKSVDLTEVIDEAIGMTSSQLREKNIVLRVDISPELPQMFSDQDALLQIILHLLQNAGAATPMEGEIILLAEFSKALDEDIVEIKVTDTGEGIPKEELPRVFSRLYRADNPLIQGVGDTGVGLSIAKTLTEALGGRIWVESELGTGSTFSLLLPVATQLADTPGG
jgi:signal transduction histidine kinase